MRVTRGLGVNSVQMNLSQLNIFSSLFGRFAVCSQQTGQKDNKKSVQLAEVHLYLSYFSQNPEFNCIAGKADLA
jgi:hypothetical protein